MEENKKIKNIKLTLYITLILCLMVGVSYATYNLVLKGNKQHQVNIGSLTLTYEETNNINVTGDTLKTDEEGIASGNVFNFKVSVNNKTNKEINYIVYLTMDIEYLNNIDKGKVYLNNKTKNIVYGPSFISDLAKYKYENSYVLCTNTFTNATETHEYSLTSWISPKTNIFEAGGTHQTIIGGTVKFKVSVATVGTTNLDESGANTPILASNMIPVYYDETNETWKKADVSNTDTDNPWYSYNSTGEYKGMWANAVTVKDTNRQTYLKAEPGTTISMDDITTMWVWIPRFKVNTTDFDAISGECSCSNTSYTTKTECMSNLGRWQCPNPGAIDISFVKQNETAIDAFTFGNKELSGFWYAKFETSHTTLASSTTDNNLGCSNETCSNANGIIIKPNVTILRWNNLSNFFFVSRSMEQTGNSFGFVSSEVDTHISKNNEWGAVAYLTQSIYGRCTSSTTCTEVYINNSEGYYTGRSGDTPSDSNYTNAGTYEYNQNKVKLTIVEGTGTNITPTITNDTTYPWVNNNGVYSSGNKEKDSTTSTLTYTFTLTDKGVVSFDYSVSSENNLDKMKYTINKDSTTVVTGTPISGTSRGTIESSLQYENKVHVLEKGTYTLVFTYSKDRSGNTGLDKGYVKNVKVLNGAQTIDKVFPGGQQASTTGTIYGIYDMSGGALEYVMGVYNKTISYSGFSSLPDIKYYNNYTGSGYSYTGHALTETKNWYSGYAGFVYKGYPWFVRGGNYINGAGVFSFTDSIGSSNPSSSSRLVISNE